MNANLAGKSASRPLRGFGEKRCKQHYGNPEAQKDRQRGVKKRNGVVGLSAVVIDVRGHRQIHRGQEAERTDFRMGDDEGAGEQIGREQRRH